MPTESLKIIAPSGGDYTSLAAWEAGEQADLVTADLYAVAEIQGDWSGGPDTTALTVSGWTTDATHYVEIRADSANSATAAWDSTKYILENTTSPIVVGVDFLYVVRVQFSLGSSTTSRKVFEVSSVGSPTATYLDGCLFRGHGYSGAYSIGLYIFDATANVYATNCVSFNHGTNSTSAAYRLNSQNQTVLYNCTAYGSYYGFRQSSGTVIAKNCISQNATVDFNGTFDGASDYNCDEDGTAPGANSVTGTVTFVAVGSDDYHLASGDTVAKDAGTDLSADATYAFSTDIDGDTRTGSWDIGADEYIAAGGGVSGSLALTLADATTSAAASVQVTATLADALGGSSLGATATLLVSGATAASLDAASLASDAAVLVAAGLSKTLDGGTASAAGKVAVTATASTTTGPASLAATASGATVTTGTFAGTLDGATLSASASARVAALVAKLLDDAGLASTGNIALAATLAASLADLALAAAGNVDVKASLAITAEGVTLSASGADLSAFVAVNLWTPEARQTTWTPDARTLIFTADNE